MKRDWLIELYHLSERFFKQEPLVTTRLPGSAKGSTSSSVHADETRASLQAKVMMMQAQTQALPMKGHLGMQQGATSH